MNRLPERLLTVDQAAKLLKMCRTSVYNRIKEGKIEALHVGPKAVRIPLESVEAYLKQTG